MATQPAAPVLFIKLPRNVVERLQTIAPSEIQLSLGGGDKNVSGALSIGSARYDVRYRAERSGAPRLFQGKAPPYSGEGECANWVSRGRVAGKLTVLQPRSRTSAAPAADRRAANTAAGMAGHISRTGATNAEQPAPHQTSLSAQPSKQEPLARARSSSAAKAAVVPQKKPGIVKQNREMLRERLLHYLAYSPLEESQVFEKIKAPSALALDTLASIGKKSGTLWTLLPEKYKDVQIEAWPRYNDRVRAQVISNALDAFDSLGLPDDDPDRVRMKQIQRRLVEGPEPSSSSLPAASNPPPSLSPPTAPKPTHNAPGPLPVLDGGSTASLPGSLAGASNAPATVAALKSPSVPSLSLPKDPPSAKKKPTRSVIAPTLAKKIGMKAPKPVKRKPAATAASSTPSTSAPAPAHHGSTPDSSESSTHAPTRGTGSGTADRTSMPSKAAKEAAQPANRPTSNNQNSGTSETEKGNGADEEGELNDRDALEEGETSSSENGDNTRKSESRLPGAPNSLPKTGSSGQTTAAHMRTSSVQHTFGEGLRSRRRLSVDRKGFRRLRAESDAHPASDAEADYGLHPRLSKRWSRSRSRSPMLADNFEGSSSRSHSHNPHLPSEDAAANGSSGSGALSEDRAKQPVQVRSRPLQTQSFAMSPGISSPHVPSVETEAAVNRVHERLVQEMADRRIPTVYVNSSNANRSAGTGPAMADSEPADGSRSAARPRHPRGPSLSPIATLPQSLSPLPAPKIERAETIEDLERLQELLATTYSEYSQLRIRIDSHCTEFEPLSAALSSALAECREARRSALEKKKSNEADREEGEEIPGDGSLASELSLNVDPTADKCLPDGSRLYWYETDDGAAWLTDSPLMPPAQGRASDQAPDGADQPVRSRLLLPAEAHVLKTNQAIVDRYAELDGDDVRRWARRYLQLHAVIEQMSKEMERAYARISGSLLAECEALRDELGECQTDSMFDGDSQRDGHVLDMDSYRNSVATLPESGDGAASKS